MSRKTTDGGLEKLSWVSKTVGELMHSDEYLSRIPNCFLLFFYFAEGETANNEYMPSSTDELAISFVS